MNKIIITSLLLIIFCSIPVSVSATWQGIDAWTGENWQALSPVLKPAFLRGIIEALKFRGNQLGPWEPVTEDMLEYLYEVDLLYGDSENTDIPIVLILDFVNSKFMGMGQGDLDYRLENLRNIADF